jgi:hypothetical protein
MFPNLIQKQLFKIDQKNAPFIEIKILFQSIKI